MKTPGLGGEPPLFRREACFACCERKCKTPAATKGFWVVAGLPHYSFVFSFSRCLFSSRNARRLSAVSSKRTHCS